MGRLGDGTRRQPEVHQNRPAKRPGRRSWPGRYLYWANDFSIGRARPNGTDVNQRFIAVPNGPSGVAGLAVSARYIYWTDEKWATRSAGPTSTVQG